MVQQHRFSYNQRGDPVEVTDYRNHTVEGYTYDNLSRLTVPDQEREVNFFAETIIPTSV